jgi:hypothetical protein
MGGTPSRPAAASSKKADGRGGASSAGASVASLCLSVPASPSSPIRALSRSPPSEASVLSLPSSSSSSFGSDPFSQRSSIDVQLVMHHLDARSRLLFARCSRSLQRDAQLPFAWEHCIINVPAMRALQDPHFLDQLRSSRFRSMPTRLCCGAQPLSPSTQPLVPLQPPTLQPSPVSDSRGSVPPSADATSEAPVSSPPLMDVLLTVAALLSRPVAIEAAGATIDWPTLLRQPNMQSITALSIKQFDVLKLHTLEVLRALPRLHHLELRLANPKQLHAALAHLPLLMQLPALDDLSCDFALWLRIAPLRPLHQLKRLELHFDPGSRSNVTRMALCVPQLSSVEVLSLHDSPIPSSAAVDNSFEQDCPAVMTHLQALREFSTRTRHTKTLIPPLERYMAPTVERMQIECVDHVPNPSLLHMLVSRRPSLVLVVRILFVDKPRPSYIDPAPFRSLTHGPLARRVRIEGLGRPHDEDHSATCADFGGPLEEGKEGEAEADRRGAVHLHPCMN